MKTELTVEQSWSLIDLGVPENKATGIKITWHEGVEGPVHNPTFTIEDLLEVLPKNITRIGGKKEMHEHLDVCLDFDGVWYAGYTCHIVGFYAKELIDALYELAGWYYCQKLISQTPNLKSEKRNYFTEFIEKE